MDKKELSFKDYSLEKQFIDYWDGVVRQWLCKNNDWKKMTDGETEEARATREQRQIIESINKTYKNDPKYKINTIHMPEPYWGNPTDCSIVLMNYNPAGGPRVNRHTTISCKDCQEFQGCEPLTDEDKKIIGATTFIKYVKENGYSHFAADESPVFKTEEILGADKKWFWDEDNGYEGYSWWQQKCGWLDHLVEIICGKKDDERWPFAMELCGWHSKEWKTDLKWIEDCRTIIKERTIFPLLKAMEKSLHGNPTKIAVCIGAGFSEKSLEKFFQDEKQDVAFQDVTQQIYDNINSKYKGKIECKDSEFKELSYQVNYEKDNIHIVANWKVEQKEKNSDAIEDKSEEKNRNYRVYKINIRESSNDNEYYILNTNYSGKNSHPGKHFWKFEEYLIDEIKNFNNARLG